MLSRLGARVYMLVKVSGSNDVAQDELNLFSSAAPGKVPSTVKSLVDDRGAGDSVSAAIDFEANDLCWSSVYQAWNCFFNSGLSAATLLFKWVEDASDDILKHVNQRKHLVTFGRESITMPTIFLPPTSYSRPEGN